MVLVTVVFSIRFIVMRFIVTRFIVMRFIVMRFIVMRFIVMRFIVMRFIVTRFIVALVMNLIAVPMARMLGPGGRPAADRRERDAYDVRPEYCAPNRCCGHHLTSMSKQDSCHLCLRRG